MEALTIGMTGKGQHTLKLGSRHPDDVVLYQEKYRKGDKFLSKVRHTFTYTAKENEEITAVMAEDQLLDDTGGNPELVSGGVGQREVTIEVTSRVNHGFHFYFYVYGVRKSAPLTTDTTSPATADGAPLEQVPEGIIVSGSPGMPPSELLQHQLEEEERHLRAYRIFIKENKTFQLSIIQLMAIGGPRMGKSSLLARLRGEQPPTIQDLPDTAHHPAITDGRRVVPSTGVAEKVIQLKTLSKKASLDTTFACKVGEVVIWSRVSYGEEVISLLKSMGMLMSLDPAPLTATPLSYQPTSDLAQIEGSEATEPLIHKSPEEIFKNALKDRNWSEVRSIIDNSLTLFCTDTGGQPEFQEVLPALIAGPSVFMLIFRVTDQLDDLFQIQYEQSADQKSVPYMSSFTLKQVILQSLASIASITTFKRIDEEQVVSIKPQVLLVATHKDQAPPERIPELQQELMELLISTEFYKKNIIKFASESTPAFVVNNLSDNQGDHQLIRSKVEEIASNKRYKEVTPAPWLVLGLVLRDLGVEAIPYDQCFSIANSCGISTKEQLNEALWFLHFKLGLVRYFHDIPEFQDVIIVQPKVIFCNITELIAETFVFTKVGQHAKENFKKYGMFSSRDIEELAQLSSDHELLPLSKMVKLLEHLHILAPIQKEDGMYYFLPCVLAHAPEAPSREGKLLASCLILAFQCGYCPKGIFSGLIAYLLSQKESNLSWTLVTNALFRDEVHLYVGKHRHEVTIRMCLTHLEVSVEETKIPQFRGKSKPHELCISIREALVKAIEVVSQTLHYSSSATIQIGFYCTLCSCIENLQHTAVCDDTDSVDNPCPETMNCTKISRLMALSQSELVWFGKQLRVLPTANTETTATAVGAPLKQVPARNTWICMIKKSIPVAITVLLAVLLAVLLELHIRKNYTNKVSAPSKGGKNLESCTGIHDARYLIANAVLRGLTDWKLLGEELGLEQYQLQEIQEDYRSYESRRRAMWRKWFDGEEKACWERIIIALGNLDEKNRAATLATSLGLDFSSTQEF